MILRPHQVTAKDMIANSIRRGKRTPVVAAPTAFGKTVLAANLMKGCQDKGKQGIFICDRIKLVDQTIDKFKAHGIDFGVMQSGHELTRKAPIQIASIATIFRKERHPEFDFAIVDECHITHKYVKELMEVYNAVPFVGLSATPYAKGMGKIWDDLLVPCTQRELLEQGYLCPVHYYAGHHVDIAGVKLRGLSTGGTDFDPKSLGSATEDDSILTGDIIRNWLEHGENSQTIAFSPTVKHSKWLVEQFNNKGIPAAHIDGYSKEEDRARMYKAHDNGEIKILSCSRLLNTGYDAPSVKCLIDCFPTKSVISYVQRVGRIMRTHPGKEYSIYLDHAGNLARFGMFAEDIIPEKLDDGEKPFKEKDQIKKKDKKEPKECPQCSKQMIGLKCSCGYEIVVKDHMESTPEILARVKTMKDKEVFYGELLLYAREKGKQAGWAMHTFKKKYKIWPNNIKPAHVKEVSDSTRKYIISRGIAYAKSNQRYAG